MLVLALSGLLLILGLAPSAGATAPATRSLANHIVLTDPVGDNEGGLAPDITGLEIFNDAAGTVSFVVSFANRPQLLPDDVIVIDLDTDRNPGTGGFGIDYMIAFGTSGPLLLTWNGTDFTPLVTQSTLTGTFSGGVLTVTINRSELGNTEAFAFDVGGLHFQGDTLLVDVGPVGVFEIELEQHEPGAPPPPKLAKVGQVKLLANGRAAKVDVRCLKVAQSPCKGNVAITATVPRSLLGATRGDAKKRTVTLGKAKFTIKPNKKKTVTVRLNKTGRKLVAKLRSGKLKKLRAIVTATAQDERGIKTRDSRPVTLKLPKKRA